MNQTATENDHYCTCAMVDFDHKAWAHVAHRLATRARGISGESRWSAYRLEMKLRDIDRRDAKNACFVLRLAKALERRLGQLYIKQKTLESFS